jgi:hypothetical protein
MQVLLVHGMGRTPLSMLRLGRKLRRAGHTVNLLGYVAALEPFARIVLRVQERFARTAARGPPNRPPRQARRYGKLLAYQWINGECGRLLMQEEFFARLPPLSIPYTIIAGTRGGPGRSAFGDEPNDGVVAVSETLVAPSDTPITVPARHTFMMNDRRVLTVILQVLQRL